MFDVTKRLMRLIASAPGDWVRGRRLRQLDEIEFRSGLGDSAWLLYGLVRSMKPEVCVEIGSARGKSACYVGTALKLNGRGRLYAIDPHSVTEWNDTDSVDSYALLQSNLARVGVEAQVEIIRQTSTQALQNWSRPIDLAFIDGDHSYEGVRADWLGVAKFLRPGGIAIFHDTIWDGQPGKRDDMGVPRLISELVQEMRFVVTVARDYGVSLVQLTDVASASCEGPMPEHRVDLVTNRSVGKRGLA